MAMVDWNFLKPVSFIVVYLALAAAVRSLLKKWFPLAANWAFLLLLIGGFVLMYYVYYEAYFLLRETLWPSGGAPHTEEESAQGTPWLQPALYLVGLVFLVAAWADYQTDQGAFGYFGPLFLGLLFIAGGLLVNYADDAEED